LEGLGRILPPLDDFLERLREIHPPQQLEPKFNEFVRLWTREREMAASASKDEDSARAYLDAPSPAAQDAEAIAEELGLADCTSGSGSDDEATRESTDSAEAGPTTASVMTCPRADGSSPRRTQFDAGPPTCIDPARTYRAEIKTNQGTINVDLDQKGAPNTVNSFVFLARNHFFDGLTFHRVVPGFVLQGGDPEGTGTGGPGYELADELPQAGQYKLGSLAMANSGPDTNGSQFFIISGDQGVALPPKYSLFGQVTEGLDVVAAIDALGNPSDPSGKPKQPITMSSVTVSES